MTKEELLSGLNFGAVDSESEINLDKIFVQTQNFKEFLNPNTALLLGSKGAGKSALYRLFTMFEKSAREMAGEVLDHTSIVAGTGFKDLPEMDDMQLINSIEAKEISPEAAWKIYIAYKVIYGLYEKQKLICGKKCRRVLQKSHTIPDYRVSAIIMRLFERFVGEPPQINQIDFKDVSISLGKNSRVSIYELLAEIDAHLEKTGKTVWVLLDKIDELFPSKTETRKACIEGLFLAYIDFVSRYKNIKLKIFLRTDIWNTLSFVNKSHLTDKTTMITWDSDALKTLLVKRAMYNFPVKEFLAEKGESEVGSTQNVDKSFDILFPERVYNGPKEAKTMDWIMERAKDGLGGVYPREIINFANCATKEEIANGDELKQEYTGEKPLISGLSIRNAFTTVSKIKVQSYLSEFANLSRHFERFTGQQTAVFTQEEIIALMSGLRPRGEDMIRQLHETGVIAYSSGQILTKDSKIIVPRLFRSGLGIITMGRP